MKRAIILHGTDGSPDSNWFPWLKEVLETHGYEVWMPELPYNHTPNRQVYNDFLFGSDWDFADNLLIGHSSGAVEVMNLLMDERCPHIRSGIMVGAWASNDIEPTEERVQAFMQQLMIAAEQEATQPGLLGAKELAKRGTHEAKLEETEDSAAAGWFQKVIGDSLSYRKIMGKLAVHFAAY